MKSVKRVDRIAVIKELLTTDAFRFRALTAVAGLSLLDGWIGAGFVRDAVWDHLHCYPMSPPVGDVDVIWFAPDTPSRAIDCVMERELQSRQPQIAWSVKNQARMHGRNGDMAYTSVADAMTHWPETATAVAARLCDGGIEVNAPFGLDDLFALRLRPTTAFVEKKRTVFQERVRARGWLDRYPLLSVTA